MPKRHADRIPKWTLAVVIIAVAIGVLFAGIAIGNATTHGTNTATPTTTQKYAPYAYLTPAERYTQGIREHVTTKETDPYMLEIGQAVCADRSKRSYS